MNCASAPSSWSESWANWSRLEPLHGSIDEFGEAIRSARSLLYLADNAGEIVFDRDLLDDTLSQVGQYSDKMRAVAGRHRAVFMVLQGFAWEMLREKNRDLAMVLYPNSAQLRFMAWQSIVHAVNGLIWWGLSYTPPEAQLWNDLKTVVRELSQVRAARAAPAMKLRLKLTFHDTGHSLDRGIEWLAKPLGRDTLLIAVNADRNPVTVTFEGLDRFHRCEPVFESRPVAFEKDALHESFEPFGTRVWRLR